MKQGPVRFEYYLSQLSTLLLKAAKQKNPALWFYQNNARTTLFKLEGLCKLYAGLHNQKRFNKLKEQFKSLEDLLGAIDYYDAFAKEFRNNKKVPAKVKAYLQAQTREKLQSLQEILTEKGWISEDNHRLDKIHKKLQKADWMKPGEEMKAVGQFYQTSILEISAFLRATKFQFDNVEADVHELRRKIRWLSIYPSAMMGAIQLTEQKKAPRHLKKYLTKEIISSPFNLMPDAGDNENFLMLEKNRFLSLSWMIAELGKLKDNGLRVIATREALQQSGGMNEADALREAYKIHGPKQPRIDDLLAVAGKLCKTYFEEKNLEGLVAGNSHISRPSV